MFDERGWCEYCGNYYQNILPDWHSDEQGIRDREPVVAQIKRYSKGYDCIIGLSGDVDRARAKSGHLY